MAQGFLSRLFKSVKRYKQYSRLYEVVIEVIENVAEIIKKRVPDKNEDYRYAYDLRIGNELCKGRMIPMSRQLFAKVKSIYRKSYWDFRRLKSTPVMEASSRGCADLVWGFIQCSKQTETNLHTQRFSVTPLDFLWLRNRDGQTALDIAILHGQLEVAKVLLRNATREVLESACDSYGKFLFPLLHDHPTHDGFILDKLEEESTKGFLPPIHLNMAHYIYEPGSLRQIINEQQYTEIVWRDLLKLHPNKNTALHIASKFKDDHALLGTLLSYPSLISSRNSDGETPFYIAAREGQVGVLQSLQSILIRDNGDIESHAIRDKDKHNALHIAIQNHHVPVVFWLLKEIPGLANRENDLKESPLYLAAERGYSAIVKLILDKCRDQTKFTGPNGKTALHAAAISNSAECIKYLLDERPNVLDEKDEYDWTPLRYAVYYNSSLALKELLRKDHSIGYQLVTQDDDSSVTSVLHIAASRGHCETMKVFMSKCLGSSEFIDSKGRNILHIAVEHEQTEVIEFLFQDESLSSLINQKDNNGDTPAYLLAESNFEMMQKLVDSRVNVHSFINEKRTPLDMIDLDEKRGRLIKAIAMGTNMSNKISLSSPDIHKIELYEKELEGIQKKAQTHFKIVDNMVLLVTLIATASFAAAFTVPGGFQSDDGSKQGTPYLLRKAAFQAFVISNAIAFSCSCSLLLGHFMLLIYRNRYDEADEKVQMYIYGRIVFMYFLTGVALLAMIIAFVTGFYVVLLPSLWLAIFVCALSTCIVVLSF